MSFSKLCCPCCPDWFKRGTTGHPYLYCFDFDHTIIDDNSDTAIMSIIRNPIPEVIRNFYDGTNWTEYIDKVMVFVAEEGASLNMIQNRIREIPFTPGMEKLLEKIRIARLKNIGSKLLIISDSNDYFIDTSMKKLSPQVIPDLIISNHAIGSVMSHTDDQKDLPYLKIEAYESQTECNLCPKNLCKGTALMNYIRKEGPFHTVYYTGDGKNDICAAMVLTENDILFVRKGYTMEKAIAKGTIRNIDIKIRARIIYFTHADEIQNIMKL